MNLKSQTKHCENEKILEFYKEKYKVRNYRILLEGTFLLESFKRKKGIINEVQSLFKKKVAFYMTDCLYQEAEKFVDKTSRLKLKTVKKNCTIHKCDHKRRSAKMCLSDILRRNNSKFIVGTQDKLIQGQIRRTPGVPLLFFKSNALTLAPPSHADKCPPTDPSAPLPQEEPSKNPIKLDKNLVVVLTDNVQEEMNKLKMEVIRDPSPERPELPAEGSTTPKSTAEAKVLSPLSVTPNSAKRVAKKPKKAVHPALQYRWLTDNRKPKKNLYVNGHINGALMRELMRERSKENKRLF